MLDAEQKLQQILDLSAELSRVNDLDLLLEKILTLARQTLGADAGSIYVRDDGQLKFSHAQNDTLAKRLPPGKKLIYTTFSLPISNDTIAGHAANMGQASNIPDVYQIPGAAPYRFGKQYDELSNYRTQSMLTTPLTTSRGQIIGVLQLINAKDGDRIRAFSHEDERLATHFATSAAMAMERAQLTRDLILRMIRMAELRDPKETGAHVNRVGAFAVEIYEQWAQARGHDPAEIDHNRDVLRIAAMLHDVGKVAVSDLILKKPGKLDPEEFEIMKRHTYLGANLFDDFNSELEATSREVALFHHENWNGSGYPGKIDVATGEPLPGCAKPDGKPIGYKGEEIPVFGRVVALADVYDALRSKRVYKDAFDEDKVLGIITEDRGRKFDPEMTDAFFASLEVLQAAAKRYPDAD